MSIDLDPNRPVSCRDPRLTLGHVLEQAGNGRGFFYIWATKDHRLLRTCKSLVRYGVLTKRSLEPGVTVFKLARKAG